MLFRQLFDKTSSTFTYLVADPDSKKAILIDPVYERFIRDSALIRELGLQLVYTLDTHVHADHVTAAWLMRQSLSSRIAMSQAAGASGVDMSLTDGDTLECGSIRIQALSTPGHTAGCMSYVIREKCLAFTGDCLLIRGAGRTDFQEGSAKTLYQSIQKKIFSLPDAFDLFPAHDYQGRTVTTVAEERAWNPRVGGQASEEDFCGYMRNLNLPHPGKIDVALPANLRCGAPEGGVLPPSDEWGPVIRTYAGHPEVEASWVAENLGEVRVLDVRNQAEFDGELGHIEGAMLIPIDELVDRMAEVPQDKPVVVVCRSGRRSAQATVLLEKAGRKKIANMRGGMLVWSGPC